jgi:hypothetical protein
MEGDLVTLNDLKDVDLTTRLGKIQAQKLIKRILTESTSLVVAFRNPHQLVIVTAWRK